MRKEGGNNMSDKKKAIIGGICIIIGTFLVATIAVM